MPPQTSAFSVFNLPFLVVVLSLADGSVVLHYECSH